MEATMTNNGPMAVATTMEQMEAQHHLWGARIHEVEAAGESRRQKGRIDRRKLLEDLKAKHRLARARLDELKTAGVERWAENKALVEKAAREVESALRRAEGRTGKGTGLLWAGALGLVVLWAIALVTHNTLGGYIHVLLLPALGVVGLRLIRLRRAA
jgi:Flp pilus assembly protein TadB